MGPIDLNLGFVYARLVWHTNSKMTGYTICAMMLSHTNVSF